MLTTLSDERSPRTELSSESSPRTDVPQGRDDEGVLQEQLLRFEGRFSARVTAAFRPLMRAERPEVRVQAVTDALAYLSAALDIAISPCSELSLLDMVTLVALGKDAMRARWSASADPERVRDIETAFASCLEDIREVDRTVLSEDLERELFDIIREWQREHPDVFDVVAVRLSQYTAPALAASAALQTRTAGLVAIVRGFAHTADSAFLLGRRALFAAQRMPFLLRMHVEIATNSALLDAQRTVADTARASMPSVQVTVADATATVSNATDRLLLKLAISGGAIAIIAAASWLVARLAYVWLVGR
jgi:hypothetical protein